MNENIKYATNITIVTLVGILKDNYPLTDGNCFSVNVENEVKDYRIVNFGYENLKELLRQGLTWPIKIKILSGRTAIIHDYRIPDDWYFEHFCGVCCPQSLLPVNQQVQRERAIERGDIKEYPATEDYPFVIVKSKFGIKQELMKKDIKG